MLKILFDHKRYPFWALLSGLLALGFMLDPGYLSAWEFLIWALVIIGNVMLLATGWGDWLQTRSERAVVIGVVLLLALSPFGGKAHRNLAHHLLDTVEQIEARAPQAPILAQYRTLLNTPYPTGPLPSYKEMASHRPVEKNNEAFLRLLDLREQPSLQALRAEQLADGYISQREFKAFTDHILTLPADQVTGMGGVDLTVSSWLAGWQPAD